MLSVINKVTIIVIIIIIIVVVINNYCYTAILSVLFLLLSVIHCVLYVALIVLICCVSHYIMHAYCSAVTLIVNKVSKSVITMSTYIVICSNTGLC